MKVLLFFLISLIFCVFLHSQNDKLYNYFEKNDNNVYSLNQDSVLRDFFCVYDINIYEHWIETDSIDEIIEIYLLNDTVSIGAVNLNEYISTYFLFDKKSQTVHFFSDYLLGNEIVIYCCRIYNLQGEQIIYLNTNFLIDKENKNQYKYYSGNCIIKTDNNYYIKPFLYPREIKFFGEVLLNDYVETTRIIKILFIDNHRELQPIDYEEYKLRKK